MLLFEIKQEMEWTDKLAQFYSSRSRRADEANPCRICNNGPQMMHDEEKAMVTAPRRFGVALSGQDRSQVAVVKVFTYNCFEAKNFVFFLSNFLFHLFLVLSIILVLSSLICQCWSEF